MKKSEVNTLLSDLKKSGQVLHITPWVFEERAGEKIEVRHVGLKTTSDWQEIFSDQNRILLSFIFSKQEQWCDVFLANSTPFIKMDTLYLKSGDKIETFLGDLRRKLKHDKHLFLHHKDSIGNLYKKIAKVMKK